MGEARAASAVPHEEGDHVMSVPERRKLRLSEMLPVWDQLAPEDQALLADAAVPKRIWAGERLRDGEGTCTGLMLLGEGILRAFVLSEDDREVTLFRLAEGDVCLLTASCMFRGSRIDVHVSAETDGRVLLIPTDVVRKVSERSAPLALFTNRIMAERLSEVTWLMEQILWKGVDVRLARFLLEEAGIEGSSRLRITHAEIANHLGTAREVVTRMLNYFQDEGMVALSRGAIELTGREELLRLASK
jgi:CRP/FNR family transcriptional regulator